MKNLLLLFCSLLILSGVFGADEMNVSVMEGESVTLPIHPADIKRASNLEWTFKDTIIAKIDIEGKDRPAEYPDERFRLKLDRQTGSLTITNITSEHSGLYKLQIRGSREMKKSFRLSVSEMSTVSLMEGDSFTLQPGVKIQTDDVIQWKFNGDDLTLNHSRVTNCDVNHRTGHLNIANIRRDQSGEYEVNINGRSLILHRTFRINVSELEPLSVNEGDSVVLHTGTETQTDDVIRWKFEGTVIAQFNRMSNYISYDDPDGRFRGRLVLNDQTGSLTITGIRSEDSGLYNLNMNNNKNIIHKRFNVTVTEPTDIYWKTIGPGLLIGVIVLGIIVFLLVLIVLGLVSHKIHKCCRNRNRLNKKEENETCERLNQQSFNTNST